MMRMGVMVNGLHVDRHHLGRLSRETTISIHCLHRRLIVALLLAWHHAGIGWRLGHLMYMLSWRRRRGCGLVRVGLMMMMMHDRSLGTIQIRHVVVGHVWVIGGRG